MACVGFHPQVGAPLGGPKIGDGGGAAAAVARGELVVAHAFLVAGVEVVHAGDTQALRGRDQALHQRMRRLDRGGVERALGAAGRARAQVIVFQLAEVGQAIVPAPARVAGGGPGVVVAPLAADVDQAIDRAGSAQRAAARPVDAPVQHIGIGVGVVAPVHDLVEHGLAVADGDVYPRVAVPGPASSRQTECAPLRSADWPSRNRPSRRPPRCNPRYRTCPQALPEAGRGAPRPEPDGAFTLLVVVGRTYILDR